MIVVRRAGQLWHERVVRLDERHVRKLAGRRVGEELILRKADAVVALRREESGHRLAPRVVPGTEIGRDHAIEDRQLNVGRPRLVGRREDAGHVDVGRRAQLVHAVGVRPRLQRAEVVVEQRVVLRERAEDRHLRRRVVADRKVIAGGLRLEPAIARAVVELDRHLGPLMLRVRERAPLHVAPEIDRWSRMARKVGEQQPRLLAVRSGHPSEEMIERPVLHHEHDNRVERGGGRIGQAVRRDARRRRRDVRFRRRRTRGQERGGRRTRNEVATRER